MQPGAPKYEPLHGGQLVLLTFVLALATFMQVLDTTIANVSIPTIAGDLGVSPNQGTWVITMFGVSNAIALPLTGWLARRFGEVRLFVISTLLFSLASWLCGLAPTFELLVAGRILQGFAAGPMVPLSQSLLLANYPPEKKGLALSFWAMTTVVAPIMGPLLGGWITDDYSWPWIFYINVPVGLFAAFLTWRLLSQRETQMLKLPIDGIGLGLLVVGVGSLQYMLDKGNELDWFGSTEIIVLAIVAVVALSFFIVWELTEEHPVVDLTLFRNRNFWTGTLAIALGYLAFMAGTVLFPLWLQTAQGYTATWAGIASAPVGVMAVILSPIIGKNLHRLNLRVLSTLAFMILGGCYLAMSHFNSQVDIGTLMLPRFVMGIGIAIFFVPLTTIILSDIEPQRIASAVGLSNFLRILAGSIGTSIATTLWERRTSLHHAQLTETALPGMPGYDSFVQGLKALRVPDAAVNSQINLVLNREATMLATSDVFWLMGCLFLALITMVWLTRPKSPAAGSAPIIVD